MTTKNSCGTSLCSCVKNGIRCIAACAKCHGNLCNNCEKAADDDDISNDEESHQIVCFCDNCVSDADLDEKTDCT